ncbi:MAG: protein phosphatase 2C domain-containing protein, partial [Bacteroidales bacterium]|nr:protein phosphatase 2C domain-containing protein [Bacteroidales bacterium]
SCNDEEQLQEQQKEPNSEEMAREITKEDKKVIQLRNGQVSIPFKEVVNLQDFNIPTESPVEFSGIEQLKWNSEESAFEGTPEESGEFMGALQYWLNIDDHLDGMPPVTREVHFLVNPDPRTLWQNIDPPAKEPYQKENNEYSVKESGERMLIGASMRGKSHAHKGTFRDDHVMNTFFEDKKWTLQVVADGAGSAEFSRQGSLVACETVNNEIETFVTEPGIDNFEQLLQSRFVENDESVLEQVGKYLYDITVGIAYKAHKAIKECAINDGHKPKDFATTLLFALSKKFDYGTVVITFSVGDGAIGVIRENEATLLMKPDGGDFSGQTCFVTMPEIFKLKEPGDIRNRYRISCFTDEVKSILLMTDGVSDPKFETENNLNDSSYWFKLWDELKPIMIDNEPTENSIFEWLDFYIPGEYDDRTISILY